MRIEEMLQKSPIVCVMALVAGLQCARPDRYYRHVYIDGTHSIVGTYEVPPESLKHIECYRITRDRHGNTTRVAHLLKGQPMRSSVFGDDVAEVELRRGDRCTELAFLDVEGKPTTDSSGVEVVRLRRDGSGHWMTRLNLRVDGTVCADSFGVILYSESLADAPRTSREVYLDTPRGIATRITVCGVAISTGGWETRRMYDDYWRCLRIETRGKAGQRVNDKEGICERIYSYDSMRNPTSVYYFDSSGRNTVDSSGAHGYRLFYDSRGYPTKRVCIDSAGWPVTDKWGVGTRTAVYDEAGLCISVSCHRSVDSLAEDRFGIATANCSYDSAGRVIELSYFGADGAPKKHPELGARVHVDYDTSGGQEFRSYDEFGRPFACQRLGAAVVRTAYNKGTWETTYLDPLGKPVRVDTSADEGHSLSISYLDEKGKPAHRRDIIATGLRIQWSSEHQRMTMTDIELRH
jgi:hypothetical protein